MKKASPQVDLNELVSLCATDGELFCRTFFPSAFRQPSPDFHRRIWADWIDTSCELSAISVFRGGAKTTLLRAYVAWCMAYRVSRTIAYIGVNQNKAFETGDWLRSAIEGSSSDGMAFAQTYGLRPGNVWNADRFDVLCRFKHDEPETKISLVSVGITSSIRGLNINAFRPDLICLDDIQSEENVGSPEQIEKINQLVYASIRNTMASKLDAPNRKMVMLQTPMQPRDLISSAENDPEWRFQRIGARGENGKSVWEASLPTAELNAKEENYQRRYQFAYFAREYLCINVPDQGQFFQQSDLRFYEVPPPNLLTVYAIDPVPPPSKAQVEKGLAKKDFEAHCIVGMNAAKDVFLLEYSISKNHQPDWSAAKFFEFTAKWKPVRVRVHAVAYETTLKWILDEAMRKKGIFHAVENWNDRRPKPVKIRQSLSGLAAHNKLYVRKEMTEFLQQWAMYPGVEHDDVIDVVAVAVSLVLELSSGDYQEGQFKALGELRALEEAWRQCP